MGKRRESSCWGSGKKGERAPAGAATTAGSGKIDSAPAGAVTAGAVGTYREESCWSRHYCGSEENSWGGISHGGVGAVGKGIEGGGGG